MKKTYFLFFLGFFFVHFKANAQVVSIPDANFLARLIQIGADQNQDGQIQNTEAAQIQYLYVQNKNIASLVGIKAFVNLKILYCYSNQLTSLDLSGMTTLDELDCGDNLLTQLDISNCTSLRLLVINNNQLSSLDVSTCLNLVSFNCQKNLFSQINVNNLVHLEQLFVHQNQLTQLNISNLTQLKNLVCYENQLGSLDVSHSTHLKEISCHYNQIQSLDVTALDSLMNLYCFDNQLTNLQLGNITEIRNLACSNNQLTSLDVSHLSEIEELTCFQNQIPMLDISHASKLKYLYCSYNQLSSIDASVCSHLEAFSCAYNNPLTTIILKNGSIETFLEFPNYVGLQQICADLGQLSTIQQLLVDWGMSNVSVNTFCSSSSTGTYLLSGSSTYDADANGCTAADSASVYASLLLQIVNGLDTNYVLTNPSGKYNIGLDTGFYTLNPQLNYPSYFSVSPNTSNIHFFNSGATSQVQDFCISPNGAFSDVELSIVPLTNAQPGFDAKYKIIIQNHGTDTVSSSILLDFMGNRMSFVSASIPPFSQNSNQIVWNYSQLAPFQSREIFFNVNLFVPPTNSIGDTLIFTASDSLLNDSNLADNYFSLSQAIVNSFDPNDISCLEGDYVVSAKIGDYLHYRIRFQNTGNFYAKNIRVIDEINENEFQLATTQVIDSFFPVKMKIEKNILQFYFDDINLPASTTNEAQSHGYIVFKIKTKPNLPIATKVQNTAQIYFDYNFPIVTNTSTTTLGGQKFSQLPEFDFYPNPAKDFLLITSAQANDFFICNTMGEILLRKTIQGKSSLTISGLARGIYYLKSNDKSKGHIFFKE